jgi:hypothetical protein
MPDIDARSSGGRRTAGWACLGVGLALLAGAAYAYHAFVQRPLSWPRVAAQVVSSRVVNPRKPSELQAEIVFDVHDGAGARRVTVVPNWSSSSYAAVRSYVDGYPPGTRLDVAVNPADRGDVRFELGATLHNLLLPGVLGLIGAVFAIVGGVVALRREREVSALPPAQTLRWVAGVFGAIGVGLCGLAVWLWTQGTPLDWPEVDAAAVEGRVIQVPSSVRRTPPRATYDIQVTFTFAVGDKTVTATTASGDTTTDRAEAENRLRAYTPGSRHRLRHLPDDANVIRFEVSALRERVVPIGLGAMGLLFLAVAVPLRRAARRA